MKKILSKKNIKHVTDFIKTFSPAVIEAEKNYGLPAEGMLAQIALETGWGKHILKAYVENSSTKSCTNNLFNIKAGKYWKGKVGFVKVNEFNTNGKEYHTVDGFRVYETLQDSINDYCKLIKKASRYKKAVQSKNNAEKYVKEIHKAGYATDPEYSNKLISIMRNYFQMEGGGNKIDNEIPGKSVPVKRKVLEVIRALLQSCIEAIDSILEK